MPPINSHLANAKKRAQNVLDNAEIKRKRKLFEYRLQIAQQGISAFQKKNISEAILSYKMYFKILEQVKGVPEGSLQPSHFKNAEEAKELLLISGVYWDLVKIYDRLDTQQSNQNHEFQHYMEKYILFSHQMPFQKGCAEIIRKHIAFGKTKHAREFKNAYRILGGSQCFIITSLLDLTELRTLEIFWNLRDRFLVPTFLGKHFLTLYVRFSPLIATVLDHAPLFLRKSIAKTLDTIALWLEPYTQDTRNAHIGSFFFKKKSPQKKNTPTR